METNEKVVEANSMQMNCIKKILNFFTFFGKLHFNYITHADLSEGWKFPIIYNLYKTNTMYKY